MASRPIFTSEDEQNLLALGILKPVTDAKRKVSVSFMQSVGMMSTEKLLDSTFEMGKFMELPAYLVSQETLECLGFEKGTSRALWEHWIRLMTDTKKQHDFWQDLIVKYMDDVLPGTDGYDEDDDWDRIMASWGIAEGVGDAITNPETELIRYTQTAREWVVWGMDIRYNGLRRDGQESRDRQQVLIERARRLERKNEGSADELTGRSLHEGVDEKIEEPIE